ncbi:MAG: magnesium/cobalt transporter CorA [Deltaproteobacteria bacterium]|nr:magnesium/cobalt transporter CorA [Deltaproteobacteria bacterium]
MTKRRSRKRKRKTKPPGLPPGTLVVDPESPPPVIHAIAYDADNIVEMAITEPETLTELMTRWPVTWINVNGLGDVAMVERLGQVFGLHRLALEDILNVTQRAKLEEYAGGYFIIAHMIRLPEHLATEQISLFVGRNFVLTFQETAGDCLDGVRDRLRHARGRVRGEGADYLAYVILDSVTDNYFPVVETFAERLDTLEEAVFTARENDIVERIHEIKTELQHLRRQLFPQQQVLSMLAKDELQLIRPETRLFFRDVQDHTVQAIELIDSHRETATGLVDAYLSMVSRKMNDVMKVLTIIATIFIPLSFIAGLYGMNFDTNRSPWNMPELRWTFGYPFALGLMASVAAGLIFFFRRRGWIGNGRRNG